MRVLIGIQARTNSKRFPKKIFEKLGDKSLLEHIYDHARAARVIMAKKGFGSQVAILGPKGDSELIEYCIEKKLEALYPTCPEDDLLSRYKIAAGIERADIIVRLTADCPLHEPQLIAEAAMACQTKDYVSNTIVRTFFEGLDVQCVTMRGLEWFDQNQKERREHPFYDFDRNELIRDKFPYPYECLISPQLGILVRGLSIDTEDDLKRIRGMYDKSEKARSRIIQPS